jgi:hypothetical protein
LRSFPYATPPLLHCIIVTCVEVLETLISAKIAENKTTAESLRNDLGLFDELEEIYALTLGQV